MAIKNLSELRFFIRRIRPISQAKNPESFKSPTRIIIPTKKRITSKEANLTTFSRSIALLIKRIETPINAKLKRKSQKNRVPNIEALNIEIDSA